MASMQDGADGSRYAERTARSIDEKLYRRAVLRSAPEVTEDELDRGLELEARTFGLRYPSLGIDCFTPSISATTIASDYQEPSSAVSQSTGPTSCSSSDRRHTYQPPVVHPQSAFLDRSVTPSLYSYTEKKASAFRNGLRRMAMFKKRKSGISNPVIIPRSTGQVIQDVIPTPESVKQSLERPMSATSEKSSWSTPITSTTKTIVGDLPEEDEDAIRRTMGCLELQRLQARQRDERDRFLEYQRKCFTNLRLEHERLKQQKLDDQAIAIKEARNRNEKAIADLESRQLEAEMDLISQLDSEKRTCLIRLRHMEAYCHTPSPPVTPSASDRSSWASHHSLLPHLNPNLNPTPIPTSCRNSIYYRRVSEKDFHNLAQQYRERDSMDSLHRAKIDVLRGRQDKQSSNYSTKKAKEIELLEAEHRSEIQLLDGGVRAEKEQGLRAVFMERKDRLERRWRLESSIERAKQESITGEKFALPEDILVVALGAGVGGGEEDS